jgi:hypothetical protein
MRVSIDVIATYAIDMDGELQAFQDGNVQDEAVIRPAARLAGRPTRRGVRDDSPNTAFCDAANPENA